MAVAATEKTYSRVRTGGLITVNSKSRTANAKIA